MKKVQSLLSAKSYDMFFDMREHPDAIIIVAGMGGLTAAAHLVKAGLRVLILERTPTSPTAVHCFFEPGEWYLCPKFTLHTLHLFALFSKKV